MYDAKYGEKGHLDYRDKPIEQLTFDEVLTSFTVILVLNYISSSKALIKLAF